MQIGFNQIMRGKHKLSLPARMLYNTLWCVLCLPVYAQSPQIKLNHFSSSHKMPGASIQCVYQDRLGVFWLGIESVGLTKYDGKTFTVYKNDPEDTNSISNNYLAKIIEDNDGNLWVATRNGLNKFDRKTGTFKHFMHAHNNEKTLASNVLNGMMKDHYGFIWVATSNGLSIVNPVTEDIFNLLHNPYDNIPTSNIEITSFEIDSNGNVWIGTLLHGLHLIPEKSYKGLFDEWSRKPLNQTKATIAEIKNFKSQFADEELNNIRCLAITKDKELWMGTSSGLYKMDMQTQTVTKKVFRQASQNRLNVATFLNLFVDSRQYLWAGTSNDGLVLLKNGQVSSYLNAEHYVSNQLKSNAIREIMESRSGIIWIATKFGGLHNYDRRQETFKLIKKNTPEQDGLDNEFVICTFEDSRQNLWIGTKEGGASLYDRSQKVFRTFSIETTNRALTSNRVESVAEDLNGNLWFATEGGLFKMDPHTYKFTQCNKLHVRNICRAKDGNFWLGTSFGLYRFSPIGGQMNPIHTRHKNFFDAESNIYITRIFEDKDGVFWIGTSSNGLFEYHPSSDLLYQHINQPNDSTSISGNLVRAIHEDAKGNLWIGTKLDGLNKFDRQTRTFTRFPNISKLQSNTIYFILEDTSGNFWMGTHSGILKFNPQTESYTSFGLNYGLQSLIFEINAFCKLHNGCFAMGGSQGLNLFNPEEVKIRSFSAPLIVSRFAVTNKDEYRDIMSDRSFHLKHNENYLAFEFALLDFTEPDANTYAYKLENFDPDWINSGNRNFVTYTNLPPGDYVFRVKGANADGDWTEKEIALQINIHIPFWRSGWFHVLMILLVFVAITAIYYIRSLVIKRQKQQLKAEVEQRTRELTLANNQLAESKLAIEQRNAELLRKSKQIIMQNQELEKHHRHLETLVTERTKDLETSKSKAEESDRLKSAFLANMSHEIRTPLNAIMGFIDILEDEGLSREEKKQINKIVQSNGNMLLQLINDIIDISLIEANQLKLYWSTINPNTFLKSIQKDYLNHKELNDKEISLLLMLPANSDSLQIHTAPERVKQIIHNLINNAIKFTQHGEIVLGYEIDEANARLICFVKDTGCGIPQNDKTIIFNRFRKLDNDGTMVHRGTGLGLAICKNLCELLGGAIWVESEVGKGSQFYFTLPLTEKEPPREIKDPAKETAAVPDFRHKTILVAEDEESNFEVIKYILKKTKINILRSFNGQEAVEMVTAQREIDFVLMDIKMPRMNGVEATKIIKAAFPRLPVVALSAFALQSEQKDFARSGFDAYLTKPVNAHELYDVMQLLLNGHAET
ncbi:MAG: two-component regulator propeller domain-containing protein [Breznakibacter sp.]